MDLVFVTGDGFVFQNSNNLGEVSNVFFKLSLGGNVDGGEVVQGLIEVSL